MPAKPVDPIEVAEGAIPPVTKASPFAALRALQDDGHVRELPPIPREPDVPPIERAAMDAEEAMAVLESSCEEMFNRIQHMQAPAQPTEAQPAAAKVAPGNSDVVQTFVKLTHRLTELATTVHDNTERLEL